MEHETKSGKGIRIFTAHSLIQTETKQSEKPYDIYRRLVGFVEDQMKYFDESQYKVFVFELLKRLRNKSIFSVYGYLRCIDHKACAHDYTVDEVVEIINKYLSITHQSSLKSICDGIKKELKHGMPKN